MPGHHDAGAGWIGCQTSVNDQEPASQRLQIMTRLCDRLQQDQQLHGGEPSKYSAQYICHAETGQHQQRTFLRELSDMALRIVRRMAVDDFGLVREKGHCTSVRICHVAILSIWHKFGDIAPNSRPYSNACKCYFSMSLKFPTCRLTGEVRQVHKVHSIAFQSRSNSSPHPARTWAEKESAMKTAR